MKKFIEINNNLAIDIDSVECVEIEEIAYSDSYNLNFYFKSGNKVSHSFYSYEAVNQILNKLGLTEQDN
jgi:hypothetical protein